MDLETRTVYPVMLEIRAKGRELYGSFPYGKTGTISDRGRVRKERFAKGAFRFAVEDEAREIHLLSGHEFSKPLASRRAGSLELKDTDAALTFRATLPEPGDQPTYMADTIKQVRAGLVGGISPGFRVPPKGAVADAERLVPEPGNPGVMIREINEAVLAELSLVSRPVYTETAVDLRHDLLLQTPARRVRVWL